MIERLDLRDRATAERVLEIQRAAYAREAALVGFDSIPPLHESLDQLQAQPLEWLGATERGVLVGAMAITGEGRACDIDRLVVDPGWHRRGIGRQLVAAVTHHVVVTVSTGRDNTPAVRLYESLGFRRVGETEVAPGFWTVQFERRNDHLATSFDADVAGYERARPGYPDGLFELLARHGLADGARVLEIGPGTGQATVALLDRGAVVTAVEPGPAMASRLRERVAGRACTVVESTFEDAALPDAPAFDLAVAATSFHWVDPVRGMARLAALLPRGRRFVPFWNVFRDAGRHDVRFQALIEPIALRFQTEARAAAITHGLDHDARVRSFEASGDFRVLAMPAFEWPITHDGASLRALFASFSDWSTLPEPDRTRALDDIAAIVDDHFDGSLTRTYVTQAYVVERR
jgi:SAM-dependent methyltransferase/GNAT superfamily N-acetyltransferase